MKKKLLVFTIILFSYMSLSFCKPNLYSVNVDSKHSGLYGENPVQYITTSNGLQVSVSADFSDSGKYVKYFFNIQNKSNKTYYFNENNIFAYEGNFQENNWYNLPYKTASKFYQDKRDDLKIGAVILGALTVGAIISSELDLDIDINVSTPLALFLPSVQISLFEPDPILAGLALANLFYFMDMADNVDSLEYLEHSLLYSTEIAPNEQYTGVVFVPEGKGPDYRVTFQASANESYNFDFARSDREKVLNPWSDKDFMVAVMGGFPVPTVNGGSIYSIISGNIMGGYFGFNFGFEGADSVNVYGVARKDDYSDLKMTSYAPEPPQVGSVFYNYRFINPVDKKEDYFGITGGITVKPVPHIYLMGGVGLQVAKRVLYGTYQYEDVKTSIGYQTLSDGWLESKTVVYFVPEVGVNVSYGILDFATVFDYVIDKGPRFNVLFGLSF